jgi:YaaC-like Protein
VAHTWDVLALYQSRDLVSSLFQARHQRTLSAAKANELVSHFAQGRGYFDSAASADALVRPLLLYYGVVALSRGLVLFLDQSAREASLSPAHGLRPIDWGATLANGISAVGDLTVETTKGSFLESLTATQNIERVWLMTAPERMLPGRIILRYWPPPSRLPLRVRFRDLLARIPELTRTFETTFKSFSDVLPADVTIATDARSTEFIVNETRLGLIDEPTLRARLSLAPDLPITQSAHQGPSRHGQFRRFSIGHPDLRAPTDVEQAVRALPQMKSNNEGATFVVTPLSDGSGLSTLVSLFAVSYITGMLVRYYPSAWMAMLSRAKGDFLVPLLQESAALISARFPALVVAELEAR